jgi:hypothetical protein
LACVFETGYFFEQPEMGTADIEASVSANTGTGICPQKMHRNPVHFFLQGARRV